MRLTVCGLGGGKVGDRDGAEYELSFLGRAEEARRDAMMIQVRAMMKNRAVPVV